MLEPCYSTGGHQTWCRMDFLFGQLILQESTLASHLKPLTLFPSASQEIFNMIIPLPYTFEDSPTTTTCPPACVSNSPVKRTNSMVCYNRPLRLTVFQISLCESCPIQYQTDFDVPNTLQCLPPGLLDVTIPAGSSCFVYTLCQHALLAPILQSPSIPIYLCLLLWATMCSIEVLNLFFFQVWP